MIPLNRIAAQNTFSSQASAETVVEDINAARSTVSPQRSGNPASTSRASIQPQREDVPAGYPKLAQRMGVLPELAVFRRFAYLNKLNLLYLQAELVDIEDKLKEIQRRDNESPELEQLYAKDWFFLNNSSTEGNNEQLSLLLNAREKLEKYSEHLYRRSRLNYLTSTRHSPPSSITNPSDAEAVRTRLEQHTKIHRLQRDGSF